MCSDCSSAKRLMSLVIVQDVVRDAELSNDFEDGQCSCGDYC
jgi:hypothetical protein